MTFQTFIDRLKRLHVSKTVWFGLAVALLGYFQTARADIDAMIVALHMEVLKPFLWPAVGTAVVVLRFITTQPLDKK